MDFESQHVKLMPNAQSKFIDMNEDDAQNEDIEMNEKETEIKEPEQSNTLTLKQQLKQLK